jgi:MoaA/NifB/PqqE/SkfB family radical SAM enzyme
LSCEHCFEWKNLDSTEVLTLEDLKAILKKFQDRGILQIQFSGGEPLSRFDDLIELIKTAQPGTDFWILTSGFGLTFKKALQLKEAGVTGVNISLDHWNENEHNHFRKNEKSFDWVKQAALNCRQADLLLCFSLCAVREFVSNENLWKYLHLARALGAGFVQILEPRKVGHFRGKDVELTEHHIGILKNFYLTVNSNPAYQNLPIVMYPGYHQRLLGCFGAGNRYLYVDSNGDLHACPFCQHKVGNALTDSISESIRKMQRIGCHEFKTVTRD